MTRRQQHWNVEDIYRMWADDHMTYQDIGYKLGISRERVGQLLGRSHELVKHLPPGIVSISEAAASLGINFQTIKNWVKLGYVRKGPPRCVNVADAAQHYAMTFERPCRVCGKPCESWYRSTCSLHRLDNRRYITYPYRVWTEHRKQYHNKKVQEWQAKNPEQYRIIQRRSTLVYRLVGEGVDREEARRIAKEKYPNE